MSAPIVDLDTIVELGTDDWGRSSQTWPKRFGRYELVRPMGSERGVHTFVAMQRISGGINRHCVVRAIPRPASRDGFTSHPLVNEARALARLSGSRIAKMYDFFETERHLVLVVELPDGVDLESLLTHHERSSSWIPLDAVWLIARELFEALASAHEMPEPVLHRDVRPSNILVSPTGEVRLMGFCTARLLGDGEDPCLSPTSASLQKGKPVYMAPEAAAGMEATARSDVYCAALVVWEMLAGLNTSPSQDERAAFRLLLLASRELAPVATLRPGIPLKIGDVLDTCLRIDPEERALTAGEVAAWLSQVVRPHEARMSVREIVAQARRPHKSDKPKIWRNVWVPPRESPPNDVEPVQPEPTASLPCLETTPEPPPPKRSPLVFALAGVTVVAAVTTLSVLARVQLSPHTATQSAEPVATPPEQSEPPLPRAPAIASQPSVQSPSAIEPPRFLDAAALRVDSPAGFVYVHGVRKGPTGTWVAAPCGNKFVRVGKPTLDGTRWLSEGRGLRLQCGSHISVDLTPLNQP